MSINQNFPATWPSLTLDFANSKTLDPRVTFTRASTGTYIGADGLVKYALADQARFDHNPVTGESLGLLIEESRTNLLNYSEDISNGIWAKQNGPTLAYNVSQAPDGSSNADSITITDNNQYLFQGYGGTGTFTFSAWVKVANGTGQFYLSSYNGANGTQNAIFTATTQWQRFTLTATVTASTGWYPCIPINLNQTFYIWGIQLEAGDFATSYIPTSTSAVTRASDSASVSGTNFTDPYNPTEGTYIVNYKRDYRGSSVQYPGLLYSHSLLVFGTGDVEGELIKNQNAVVQLSVGIASATEFKKMGIVYNQTSYGGCLGGGPVVTGSGGFHPSLDTSISFGVIQGITAHRIKSLTYYPERLTNAQLQALTK